MPPVNRNLRFPASAVEKWAGENWQGEGYLLPMMLSTAVPLWMDQFSKMTFEERERRLTILDMGIRECDACDGTGYKSIKKDVKCSDCKGEGYVEEELCLKMEYVLHRGPKEGQSARAFNDLAQLIALLSFSPGGIHCFGVHWHWENHSGKVI